MTILNRTNLCANPSLESATTGWSAAGTTAPTITQDSTTGWSPAGTKSLKVAWSTTNTTTPNAQITFNTTAGLTYTCSLYVKVPIGHPPVGIFIVTLGALGTYTTIYDQWQRLSVTFTATGTTHAVGVTPHVSGPIASGKFCNVDAVLCEQSGMLLPYFDGSTSFANASWSGTAGLSTSNQLSFDTAPGMPGITVEFDALPTLSTDFVLDTSLLDGPLLLVDRHRFVDVPSLGEVINSIYIQRGKSDPNGETQPGFATLECDNWTGNFDPENPNSAFNRGGLNFHKGMLCRITVYNISGTLLVGTRIFTGHLSNVTLREGLQPTATLSFEDDLATMGTTSMPMYNNSIRPQETAHDRAIWLYNVIGSFTHLLENDPVISAALNHQLVPTYGGGSILDEMNDLAAAEVGRAFVDRFGIFTVHAHTDEITNIVTTVLSDSEAIYGAEFADLTVSSGGESLVNQVRVRRYSQDSTYPDVFGADEESISLYGPNSQNGAVGYKAPLFDIVDTQNVADYLAHRRSRPATLVDSVTVDYVGNDRAFEMFLPELDLGSNVQLTRTVPYLGSPVMINLGLVVEGIQFAITPDSFAQTLITLPTDQSSLFAGAGIFLLDSSLLDGTDVLSSL